MFPTQYEDDYAESNQPPDFLHNLNLLLLAWEMAMAFLDCF